MAVQVILPPNDPFFEGKPYDWEGILFTTVQDWIDYLANPAIRARLDAWADGVTVHHTWRPTVAQWRANSGAANLKGLIRTWRDDNGWSTGPNMIIAPEGIYLASGVDGPGIHATVCNGKYVGIEVVGNYDLGYWQEPIRSFVFGAVVALCKAMRITPAQVISRRRVNGHRECNSTKTCPGKAIDIDKFRRDVAALMTIQPAADATVIGVAPSINADQFKQYGYKYGCPIPPGEMDRIYTYSAWLQVDPAFTMALWKQEAFVDDPTDNRPGRAVLGGSELQRQSHCPLNIEESADSLRDTVEYAGKEFRKWNTWQYGWYDAVLYEKQVYGDDGLNTVRSIIPAHYPNASSADRETFINNILLRMKEMKAL